LFEAVEMEQQPRPERNNLLRLKMKESIGK